MCCLSVGEPGGLRGTCFIMFQASFCFPAASLQAPYLHSEDEDPPSRKKAHLQPGLGLCKGFNGQGPAWQTQHIFVTKTNRLGRLSHSLSRHTASYETQNETKRNENTSFLPDHVVSFVTSSGRVSTRRLAGLPALAVRWPHVLVLSRFGGAPSVPPSQRHRNAIATPQRRVFRCHNDVITVITVSWYAFVHGIMAASPPGWWKQPNCSCRTWKRL